MDASHEEGLAGVDITDADDDVVVHDVLFDGLLFKLGFFYEVVCAEVICEWLGAEFGEEWVCGYFLICPENTAESAWVVVAHL